jgi:hypothetical protein
LLHGTSEMHLITPTQRFEKYMRTKHARGVDSNES